MQPVSCWVITDGKAGMESQCIGLAEALELEPVIKRVSLRTPWRQSTPYFRLAQSFGFAKNSDRLDPPWPDLIIATGRGSVAASLHVRRQARRDGKRTIAVQLQNPGIAPSHFDLVVTPMHDGLKGPNVVQTLGALHRVTKEKLDDDAERLAARLGDLPQPYIGVLVGGANAAFEFTPDDAAALGRRLASAALSLGGSLLITPSRRTPTECGAALKGALSQTPHFYWEGEGSNPYFGILGLAEYLVVTSDSVNMVSEAFATGKPVYVVPMRGGSAKFERFHRGAREAGLTRPFTGPLERYSYAPPSDLSAVTERVGRLLGRGRPAAGAGNPPPGGFDFP